MICHALQIPQSVVVPIKWITSITVGTARNNFTGVTGATVVIGSKPITIKSLARWVISGNTLSHNLYFVRQSDQNIMCSAVINTSSLPVGFNYITVPDTILASGITYYLLSSETNGGDQWYDLNTAITTTSVASCTNNAYSTSLPGTFFQNSSANHPFVPLDFTYTT